MRETDCALFSCLQELEKQLEAKPDSLPFDEVRMQCRHDAAQSWNGCLNCSIIASLAGRVLQHRKPPVAGTGSNHIL